MCLITRNPKQIATEDITCYKVLNEDLTSIYHQHQYALNTKYEQPIEEDNNWLVVDSYGVESLKNEIISLGILEKDELHSFNNAKMKLYQNGFRCYGKGFHSFASVRRAIRSRIEHEQVLYNCIIPAGSEYIIDNNECIISNQIIITKQNGE